MIFLAEDDDELRGLLAESLRADGHRVIEASDGDQLEDAIRVCWAGQAALRPIARGDPSPPGEADELVICDLLMPGRTGLQVLDAFRDHGWSPPFILMTGFADDEVRDEALRLGALAVIEKPLALDLIRDILGQKPAGTRP
jgi:two-component system, OmpR family, alkaline phosphatase synthesis response regulator PhoP